MSGTLMLVNPRPRKKRKASPAQLAALARGRAKRARKNPAAPVRARKNPAPLRAATNPRRRRRARRNPIGGMSMDGLMGQMMQAAQGAGGALLVDVAMKFLPLPAALKTGNTALVTKAALAVGVGVIGRKFMGRTAARMAEGALTVQAYGLMKSMANKAGMGLAYAGPAETVDGLAEYLSEYPQPLAIPEMAGIYDSDMAGIYDSDMAEYVSPSAAYSF